MKLWSDCSWIHGAYDMNFGTSWGFAGRELQRNWKQMGCDGVMKSRSPPPWSDPFWQTRMFIISSHHHHIMYHISYPITTSHCMT
jgi:hypothetical protein